MSRCSMSTPRKSHGGRQDNDKSSACFRQLLDPPRAAAVAAVPVRVSQLLLNSSPLVTEPTHWQYLERGRSLRSSASLTVLPRATLLRLDDKSDRSHPTKGGCRECQQIPDFIDHLDTGPAHLPGRLRLPPLTGSEAYSFNICSHRSKLICSRHVPCVDESV
jgi:hypothetical protein